MIGTAQQAHIQKGVQFSGSLWSSLLFIITALKVSFVFTQLSTSAHGKNESAKR